MVLFQKMTVQFPRMFFRIDTVLNFQKKIVMGENTVNNFPTKVTTALKLANTT